jgi:hypothetical protein
MGEHQASRKRLTAMGSWQEQRDSSQETEVRGAQQAAMAQGSQGRQQRRRIVVSGAPSEEKMGQKVSPLQK